jgi:competence protein ComEC
MRSYDVLFYGVLFFLIGVMLASLCWKIWIIAATFLVAAVFICCWLFQQKRRFIWLAGLAFLMMIGALYYTWDDLQFRKFNIIFDQKTVFAGVIVDDPSVKTGGQEATLKLEEPFSGNILLKLSRYPEFRYGDELRLEGVIKKPEAGAYADYLAKERTIGISSFAKVEVIGSGRGSAVKAFLFGIKRSIIASFQKVLPGREAAFLTGLTLGGQSEFSDEFKNAMKLSGTTHLVALSGYNITIIVWFVMGILVYFVKRRYAFIATIFFIIAFVMMAGAEASVVRAAIMGLIVLLAREAGRVYDLRNAVVLAGLAMVLQNPKVLAFDVGFQLSFLAVLGIVYLRPALANILKAREEPGLFSWRDNLLTTTAAQLAVAPLLIASFGKMSLTSLVANVLILDVIPLTMGLGFIIAAAAFFSYYFSLVLAWVVWIFLVYEIFIINLFAKLSIPFSPGIGWATATIYYAGIIFLIIYARRKGHI